MKSVPQRGSVWLDPNCETEHGATRYRVVVLTLSPLQLAMTMSANRFTQRRAARKRTSRYRYIDRWSGSPLGYLDVPLPPHLVIGSGSLTRLRQAMMRAFCNCARVRRGRRYRGLH